MEGKHTRGYRSLAATSARSSGSDLLGRAAAAMRARRRAEVEVLEAALGWAHAHVVTGRLPRLWALVRGLRVPVRLAREAARVSRDLDVVAAAHADRLLAWQPRRLNPHRIGVLVHEARLYADPDRAIADHDTADAFAFDHTVSTMATTMRALGHPGDLGVRRAHAVGILATPEQALDLLAEPDVADPDRPFDPDHDPGVCVAEEAVYATPSPFRRPTRLGGTGTTSGAVTLVVHVTDTDLLAGDTDGVARTELGPMLLGRLRSWLLTAGAVTVTPVLDLVPSTTRIPAVDRHDPPAAMAEAVRLRDLDHIHEYVPLDEGGPPGQTHPANLAPLCRRHHRAKTFGAFTYHRLPDGSYQWTLPSGRILTTDPRWSRPRP